MFKTVLLIAAGVLKYLILYLKIGKGKANMCDGESWQMCKYNELTIRINFLSVNSYFTKQQVCIFSVKFTG